VLGLLAPMDPYGPRLPDFFPVRAAAAGPAQGRPSGLMSRAALRSCRRLAHGGTALDTTWLVSAIQTN
jgi:hypothetical protein